MLFRLARIGYPQEFCLAAFAGGLWPWAGVWQIFGRHFWLGPDSRTPPF